MTTKQGGSHEQHVKAGEQSHKGSSGSSSHGSSSSSHEGSSRGGTHEQRVKAGEQSHKNTSHTGSEKDWIRLWRWIDAWGVVARAARKSWPTKPQERLSA